MPQLRRRRGHRGGQAVSRLRRFETHRFIGRRDTMVVYDCDRVEDFTEVAAAEEALVAANLLMGFGPDSLVEARNRGFKPVG